jgi:hypothetical protein
VSCRTGAEEKVDASHHPGGEPSTVLVVDRIPKSKLEPDPLPSPSDREQLENQVIHDATFR